MARSCVVVSLLLLVAPADAWRVTGGQLRRRTALRHLAAAGAAWLGAGETGSTSAMAAGAPAAVPAAAPAPVVPAAVSAAIDSGLPDKTIGEIPASGIIFKDIVKVDRVNDPKVEGVMLYVSDFQRPITERLQNDFFSDPALAAVSCLKTGKVRIDPSVDESEEGEEVFSQARSLLFKTVKVRRLYDREAGALVYVSYSTRLDKGADENKSRYKTSICAVKID